MDKRNKKQQIEMIGDERVQNYYIRIEVPEGEVKNILDELAQAQNKIYECYNRLEDLGVSL
ncbi:hypothetical protein QA584_17465 [Anaerocolumna sp. AGMB13025]|uniref:hypothetical protein n=1 Tax=Anaerocolumna sp. AGMB13025 TaxID=3039116 RepID=UPI00241D8B0F|nr:hypothetical protein [Anaerocolumna sp. AGMB13025]WFR55390.1 hypothetical protein QA584_17465 [Anaerocolumna sp. AGMB13025]